MITKSFRAHGILGPGQARQDKYGGKQCSTATVARWQVYSDKVMKPTHTRQHSQPHRYKMLSLNATFRCCPLQVDNCMRRARAWRNMPYW